MLAARGGASIVLAAQSRRVPPRTAAKPDRRAVPVLMYHVIDEPPRSAPFPGLYVSRAELRAQVRWLARAGYEAVTLGRVVDAWNGRATLPARPIVLSFDDGYRSHVTAALPILAAQDWPGVLNLDVSNLAPSWGIPRAGVRRLIAAGWEIDAHSMTHADLAVDRRCRAAARGRRLTAGDPPPLRRHAALLLLPGGRYDAETDRSRRGGRVRGSDDDRVRARRRRPPAASPSPGSGSTAATAPTG